MYSVTRINSSVFLSRLFLFFILCLSSVGLVDGAEPVLNINTASPQQLADTLPGIGPAKAKAIVMYREEHGVFQTLDALIEVKGIGPRTLEKIRRYLFVSDRVTSKVVDLSSSLVISNQTIQSDQAQQSQASIERANRRAVQAAVNVARRAGDRFKRLNVNRYAE